MVGVFDAVDAIFTCVGVLVRCGVQAVKITARLTIFIRKCFFMVSFILYPFQNSINVPLLHRSLAPMEQAIVYVYGAGVGAGAAINSLVVRLM